MKLFIDFDGVLFNSKSFREELISQFEKSGFSRQEVFDTYNAECLDGNYSPADHLERLKEIRDFNLKMAQARADSLVKRSKSYLYDDVLGSLKNISKLNYEVNLLTLGNPSFQPKKIKESGIRKYFDNIYCTSIPKAKYLQDLIDKNEKFIVVDDRGDALEEISAKFPKAITIEMRREEKIHDPAERSSHFSGPRITNLKQLIEIL